MARGRHLTRYRPMESDHPHRVRITRALRYGPQSVHQGRAAVAERPGVPLGGPNHGPQRTRRGSIVNIKGALLAGADLIEAEGWNQGGMSDGFCAVQALSYAMPGPEDYDFLYPHARNALVAYLGIECDELIPWNDAPGRTKEEVVAAFRAAAEAQA